MVFATGPWADSVTWVSSCTDLRAGIRPDPAHSADFLLIQSMNTLDASNLLSSLVDWRVMKKWCELAQTASWSPILGIGASTNGTLAPFRSLICQMPSQVTASLSFLKPTYCVSMATFLGL